MFLVHVKPTINKVYSSKGATGRVWTKSSGRNHNTVTSYGGHGVSYHRQLDCCSGLLQRKHNSPTVLTLWWVSTGDQWIPITNDPWVYYGRTQQIEGMRLGICLYNHILRISPLCLCLCGDEICPKLLHTIITPWQERIPLLRTMMNCYQ